MGLEAGKKMKLYGLGDFSGGVNHNDPAISLPANQCADAINAVFQKKGFKRWCGAKNLTVKDACDDYLRGLYHTAEIDGTQHLLVMFGGKLYEINKTTGAVSAALIDATGTGELWGGTHWGKFYATNGAKVFKVEGSTAYPLGLTPPAAGTSGKTAGGTLPNGVYKIKIGYARKDSGLNVLYSQGYDLANVTLGGGDNTITIANFANSAEGQVNNKVVWMTLAGGATYYFFYETGNNTSTSFNITSDAGYENAIVYDQFASPSGLPAVFTFLLCFDNRIFGLLGNSLYYSQKAVANSFALEQFPTLNKIDYPFQLTGLFAIGTTLFINTADNGVLIQDVSDLGSRFSHFEKKTSFKYMRTVVDWNGGKLGLTKNGLQFFDGTKFDDFDYAYNIRPKIQTMFLTATANLSPVGIVYNRDNRLEYHLSFCNTAIGSTNNNRTYVLNLSQIFFQDNQNFKTPWEIVGRGFNYAAVDASGNPFYGQSFAASSTIYVEEPLHTTEIGIYDDAGEYLDAATPMALRVQSKIYVENMFTKTIIEEMAIMFQLNAVARLSILIADDPGKMIVQDTDISAYATSLWDTFLWDTDLWAVESQQRYGLKGATGTFGYSWYMVFGQTADDDSFLVSEIDVLATLETGRGI